MRKSKGFVTTVIKINSRKDTFFVKLNIIFLSSAEIYIENNLPMRFLFGNKVRKFYPHTRDCPSGNITV
jgi:hypothetical protein